MHPTAALRILSIATLAVWLPAQADGNGRAPATSNPPAAVPTMPVIAVVDFAKVLENYPKAIAERERLDKMRRAAREQVDALTRRIKEAQEQLGVIEEGTMEHARRQLDIELLAQQRPALTKLLNEQLALEEMRVDIVLYEDAEFAVAKVAKERGVQIVLRKLAELPPRTEGESAKETQARVMTFDRRQVWYAAPEVDLTPHVIKFLQVPLQRPAAGQDKEVGSGKTGGGN